MTTLEASLARATTRLKLVVRGAVQGVGFRPFVYRLASELDLAGWVNNSPQGVFMEVEGAQAVLEQFRRRLETEKPPRSFIQSLESTWLDAIGYDGFVIRESGKSGHRTALVLPDIATCPDCLREIFDPANRRHRHPFTNCTNCGPRFSIIEALPYDRANTSMRGFKMCPACEAEYDDPRSRRFHAQPNACSACGPQLELWEPGAGVPPVQPWPLARGHAALLAGVEAIRRGQIVAVKGIGGFHLLVDARNAGAVRRLRERKHREEKPFALMFPSLPGVMEVCEVSALEERLLHSPEAPIVLLRRRPASSLRPQASPADGVAPGNPNLGVMLPSNPLHHLLMAELGFPVVATSGNLSDEPICTDEHEALDRLRGIADVFLVHNRPIVRHLDDSIALIMSGREMVLRRARGYAPLPVQIPDSKLQNQKILAVGAHLKNSIALAVGEQVFLSQHIGDLETEQSDIAFRRAAADLPQLYGADPDIIAADLHPDYLSTKFALERQHPARRESEKQRPAGPEAAAPRVIQVQHHIAHVLSCLAENEAELPALGVAWDGTGYGTDGTIWGGEFFLVTGDAVERLASFRPFRLPGGDAAVKEPRRAALGLLHELADHRDQTLLEMRQKFAGMFPPMERAALETAMARGLNSPWCSSAGRLFDAVAALVGLRQQSRFEGQAAMELEFAIDGTETGAIYELPVDSRHAPMQLDWSAMIAAIAADLQRGVSVGEIAAKFHNTLVEAIVEVARRIGCPRVALSGGCFQNRYLTEHAVTRLREAGFQPYWHQRVPTNDGGLALGQVFAARHGLG
ncbi:MAG: carbamoyltransferase HypF [Verrucomicrobia bacterium]|nr:carbamoyltransferase HypF [Verrucomicrobiota bacterium]